MKRAWKPYARLELHAPNIKKVVKWGTKRYDEKD